MGKKKSRYSIEAKLARAIRNRNQREIDYYTQIIDARKINKASKRSKPSKKNKKASTFIDPLKLAKIRRQKLLINPTPSEVYIRGLLDSLEIKYEFQHIIFTTATQFYILDFYIPESRICIELDGFHHYNDPKQLEHDKIRDAYLKGLNIRTIRLSNTKALSLTGVDIKCVIDI